MQTGVRIHNVTSQLTEFQSLVSKLKDFMNTPNEQINLENKYKNNEEITINLRRISKPTCYKEKFNTEEFTMESSRVDTNMNDLHRVSPKDNNINNQIDINCCNNHEDSEFKPKNNAKYKNKENISAVTERWTDKKLNLTNLSSKYFSYILFFSIPPGF